MIVFIFDLNIDLIPISIVFIQFGHHFHCILIFVKFWSI